MKKIIKNVIEVVIPGFAAFVLTGVLFGLAYLATPKRESIQGDEGHLVEKSVENLNPVCWYVVSEDGINDALVTPHRNSNYGSKGPVYTGGQGNLEGERILSLAKEVIDYKNDFSKRAGFDKEFYWNCRVDDFDEDGVADRVSWPRLNNMPVYEKPFSSEMKSKANKIISLEKSVLDYILNGK